MLSFTIAFAGAEGSADAGGGVGVGLGAGVGVGDGPGFGGAGGVVELGDAVLGNGAGLTLLDIDGDLPPHPLTIKRVARQVTTTRENKNFGICTC